MMDEEESTMVPASLLREVRLDERANIIKLLEETAERNRCTCGDTCMIFDSGFEAAISLLRNKIDE